MEDGQEVEYDCFGDTQRADSGTVSTSGDGDAYVYRHQMDWATSDRCSVITSLVAVAGFSGDLTVNNLRNWIPGFPDGNSYQCPTASNCTIISVEGYNKSCDQINSFGTIQREVLLEF